jgi:hypothetical protein
MMVHVSLGARRALRVCAAAGRGIIFWGRFEGFHSIASPVLDFWP